MKSALGEVDEAVTGYFKRTREEARLTIACLKEKDVVGAWEHYELMKASMDAAVSTMLDALPPA